MLVEQKLQMRQVSGVRCQVSEPPPTPDTRHPTPRSGLSLTEVLIAMGILTLGLLGVASVFPVGSYYMKRADIYDQGSAIAQSVMNDIMARGMLNPRSWYVIVPNGLTSTQRQWNTKFSQDGANSPTGAGAPRPGSFTRPLAAALAEGLNQQVNPLSGVVDPTVIAKQFGSAYVIDPLGMSFLSISNGNAPFQPDAQGPAAVFPASAYRDITSYAAYGVAWAPWFNAGTVRGFTWPIRRVTFRETSTGWHMGKATAEHYFRGSDDLSYDFPSRDDRPAIQTWDTNGPTPLARKWAGDYSWIVTVAPTSNAARDAIARNPEGSEYNVSVVVFYKRPLAETADDVYQKLGASNNQYLGAMSTNERAVKANVISTGLNGGELLLTDWGNIVDTNNQPISAFDQLKANQWIMLCGPHPNSSTSDPKLVLNWYQVISIDSEGRGVVDPMTQKPFDPTKQRVVALRGPEWPWQPSTISDNASNDLCVGICKGAVAVNTKTMRLEAGGAVSFGTAAGSGGTGQPPDPWIGH